MRRIFLAFFVFSFLLPGIVRPAAAGVSHDLRVRLMPERNLLTGVDEISLSGKAASRIRFHLSPRAHIRNLSVNGKPAEYRFFNGMAEVVPQPAGAKRPVRLRIEYEAVFDDPVPEAPANTDNPGFGVTGIIGEQGTFLLSGAGWYPRFSTVAPRFSITVDAPEGIVAVTAGRSTGRSTENGRTLSSWKADRAPDGLSLSAGAYVVTESTVDDIQVATYFSPQTQPLSDRYIDAVKRYLKMYGGLFGPYPFEKFAVVENFFPTGYGFASYTLMGGVVLRLPFIIDVSLGHEIAHCWWGNGVRVDYSGGNWSEGLTTYVADYLYKERDSAEAAEQYRRQWLRNYALLVDAENDFPLSEFIRRTDRATKVIGYDKSAMVFHMLRQILGETVFWGGLKDVYAEKKFQRASWEDFRTAFERRAGYGACCTLEGFFDQWIGKTGAPMLVLDDVSRQNRDGRWWVNGTVRQRGELFDIPVKLQVRTDAGVLVQQVSLHGAETSFSLQTAGRPAGVALDPGADVFRRLHPEEIPASVNSIKGAGSVSVVISRRAGKAGRPAARMLIRSLGLSGARIVDEADFDPDPGAGSRVYIGFPDGAPQVRKPHGPVSLFPGRFSVDGRVFGEPTDTFFGVLADPHGKGGAVAVLYPVHPRYGPLVARKVTHYGKYSYLAFERGQNAAKGVWPVTDSPMIVEWE